MYRNWLALQKWIYIWSIKYSFPSPGDYGAGAEISWDAFINWRRLIKVELVSWIRSYLTYKIME